VKDKHILLVIYAFFLLKKGNGMRRVWGYTLFWFALGMLAMYVIGRGLLGIVLIGAALLLSYWLFT
jgi:4-amino-4-deoxy-L-arabinose transferase-like glycosyltransferase